MASFGISGWLLPKTVKVFQAFHFSASVDAQQYTWSSHQKCCQLFVSTWCESAQGFPNIAMDIPQGVYGLDLTTFGEQVVRSFQIHATRAFCMCLT